MNFRTESDFLGEKKIPADAYYGVQTIRAVENFPITGSKLHPALIRAMALVKKAAAMANKDVNGIDPLIADAIVRAANEVIEGKLRDQFVVDPIQGGAGTSVNMNANEVLANRALEILGKEKGAYDIISPNDHLNLAQSTNDAFPTAVHLAILELLDGLLKEMASLSGAFGDKAKEFSDIIKMGRTHLQDAVPIRLGQEFEAYKCVIDRDIRRISATKDALCSVNMGATAVGTGLNADENYITAVNGYLAQLSGFPLKRAANLVDATQNTDAYLETSSMLKICMMSMSKICNDLRLMASGPRCGLNELFLPARQPGSSIMPGKVNPVMAEVVNQVAFQVAGNDLTVSMGCEAGQFELNVMEPVVAYNIIQSISMMTNAFRVFRQYLLKDLKANIERMKEYVDNSVGVITALNPHIGYKTAARIAKEAIDTGKPVRDLILRDKLLKPEELDIILNPVEMTTPGISGAMLKKK